MKDLAHFRPGTFQTSSPILGAVTGWQRAQLRGLWGERWRPFPFSNCLFGLISKRIRTI